MQYELGDIVLFDGGPALIIGRDTEDRTYLVEFTGATGKREKTVTDRDLDDAPTEWHVSNHLDLVHEVMALRKEVKEDEIERLKTENTALINLYSDVRFPAIKGLQLASENAALKAQVAFDQLVGKEGLALVMALQPLLVTYADASRAYFDPREKGIDEEHRLYHEMKVAESAIHTFVNMREASIQVAEIKALQAEVDALKAQLEWDDERRNKLFSLLESYAETHRQFHYPDIEEIDTEDTPVMDDVKALWGLRHQIVALIGIPPLKQDA